MRKSEMMALLARLPDDAEIMFHGIAGDLRADEFWQRGGIAHVCLAPVESPAPSRPPELLDSINQ
jgi:hypothetical protein